MKEIELKNGKRVGSLALVLFASVALAAIVLLLPAFQNIAIAFGEKYSAENCETTKNGTE